MDDRQIDRTIALAWSDRVSFEEIRKETGLAETEVISLMRRELKPASFRRWRKRVSGRGTKHRERWKALRKGPKSWDDDTGTDE